MSPGVFYIEYINRGSTVAWKISNEVHIFDMEHTTGDMNFFMHPFKCGLLLINSLLFHWNRFTLC